VRWPLLGLLLVSALALAACGGGGKKAANATTVSLTITQSGKTTSYQLPASVKGGLVRLKVTNKAKAPHTAQLVRIEGNHSIQDVLKVVTSNSPKTPDWVRGEGGLGGIPPGQTQDAVLNLKAGRYIVGDLAGESSKSPGYKQFTVTSGTTGSLPSTPTTITAAQPSKDHWRWDVSGSLKTGTDNITFDSKGTNTIHLIAAFRITGKHSDAEIIKLLKSNAPPPKFVDQSTFANTAVLDDGLSQTTPLTLSKPGRYVLFCPLTDRNGGKPHFEEGLLKQVDVS
jgi:hypothetical protein